ncbi:MAG: hypothetical protein BroJett001_26830 [Chloroflexota bacterium]|nr:MAG: hypothetical protein BroJett001_26830 [Chloroflexota bacterium]
MLAALTQGLGAHPLNKTASTTNAKSADGNDFFMVYTPFDVIAKPSNEAVEELGIWPRPLRSGRTVPIVHPLGAWRTGRRGDALLPAPLDSVYPRMVALSTVEQSFN